MNRPIEAVRFPPNRMRSCAMLVRYGVLAAGLGLAVVTYIQRQAFVRDAGDPV